jgi:hypothetical protein
MESQLSLYPAADIIHELFVCIVYYKANPTARSSTQLCFLFNSIYIHASLLHYLPARSECYNPIPGTKAHHKPAHPLHDLDGVCSINQFYKLGDYSVFVSQFFNKMG